MKTPREILLERHSTAEPKLNKLRQETINAEFHRRGAVATISDLPGLFWRELIWPCRRIWTGLATAWVLILAAHLSMRDGSQIVIAKSSSPQEIIMAWQQQQQLLAELIGLNETKAVLPTKLYSPRPSSERQVEIATG
jgi:hypothetical protein